MWGQSFATAGLLDSLIAEMSDGTMLVGRGVPDDWITEGKVIELSNYPIAGNQRMGLKVEGLPNNQVRLTLTEDRPDGQIVFNLPVFINNIRSATAGVVDKDLGTLTLDSGISTVTVELASSP
jgi:hypothetical protein